MNRHSANHQFRTLLILVVFAFSLLPRQLVHNFVTNHQHVRHAGYVGEHLLSPETINCSGDDIFLHQSFTTNDGYSGIKPLVAKTPPPVTVMVSLLSGPKLMSASRGPPSRFL